jgi:hypothetical protein
MKNFLQQTGLLEAAVATKRRALKYLKAARRKVKNENSSRGAQTNSQCQVENGEFHLTKSELAFIQEQFDQGNKEFGRLLGLQHKNSELAANKKIKISLNTARSLIDSSLTSTDTVALLTFILNHADFPASNLIMSKAFAPEIFRDLAILFRSVNKCTSFWLIARAKMLRPNGPLISSLFESIADEYIATLSVGIGVITYNRKDYLAKTVEAIGTYTTGQYQLVVADDGSKDDTSAWCKKNNIPHISCANKGVVRNKNRALYYLNEVKKVDVLILLEDDCRPSVENWQRDWVIAALLWGHINYAHKRIINKESAVVSGAGSSTSPYLCKLVTGQCTACSKGAMSSVGYLDPRFNGYGAGHVEWTERFIRLGYNGTTEKHWVYPAINTGLNSDDAPTFKNPEQLEKNRTLKKKISKESHKREAWVDTNEKVEFLQEIESINI